MSSINTDIPYNFRGIAIKTEPLRSYLSANIKARREALNISQEKLAELANVSVQMIKRIEGRRTWVSDKMLTNLARVLGISAFQLLVPTSGAITQGDTALISGMLQNLRQNIQDDINSRFDRLIT
ncbi:MAG: helix-turn-helix transcriptional regulator [Treponema sp.]|nr:helix-turn-helix transcriptional regulator [Treponema sp.]